jgi:hypothetical protein
MGREVRAFAAAADLDVLLLNDHDNWPHAVLRARVSAARDANGARLA